MSGNAAIVRVLLAGGADPNRQSNGPSDGTPLCGAASWDHQEAVKALLEGGADPNQPEQDGFVPLSLAVEAMHRASAEYLLAAGADPNHESAVLVMAAERGSSEIVRALLAHGADPSLADNRGRTALDVAQAKVGVDLQQELSSYLPGDGPVEFKREPHADGSHRISAQRTSSDGTDVHCAATDDGHAQIVALLLSS